MGRLNDLSLVAQVTVFGNKRAFDQLVRENQSAVRRFFLGQTLGNESLSDDLAQDTFLKAYTSIGQFRGMSSFQTWLIRIAYNVWYDHCRKNSHQTLPLENQSGMPVTEAPLHVSSAGDSPGTGLRHDLSMALAQLRREVRVCITLQLIDGYSIDEIASITNMPVNTVKSHLRRGKDKLAEFLRKNGYDR